VQSADMNAIAARLGYEHSFRVRKRRRIFRGFVAKRDEPTATDGQAVGLESARIVPQALLGPRHPHDNRVPRTPRGPAPAPPPAGAQNNRVPNAPFAFPLFQSGLLLEQKETTSEQREARLEQSATRLLHSGRRLEHKETTQAQTGSCRVVRLGLLCGCHDSTLP
jgi:hypothetical protein